MNTQKLVTTTMLDKAQEKICIRTCSRPTADAQQIYQAPKLKHLPYHQKNMCYPNYINDLRKTLLINKFALFFLKLA